MELGSKPQHRRPQELEAAGSRAGSGAGSSGAGNEPEKGEGRAELAGGDVRVQRRPWLAKQRGGGRWRRSRNVVRRRQSHDVGHGRRRDDTTRTPWQGGGELEAERREEEARARGGEGEGGEAEGTGRARRRWRHGEGRRQGRRRARRAPGMRSSSAPVAREPWPGRRQEARGNRGERGGSGEGLALPSPCVTALGRDKTNEGRVRRSDGAG